MQDGENLLIVGINKHKNPSITLLKQFENNEKNQELEQL